MKSYPTQPHKTVRVSTSGFSLIELLVSIALFTIVVFIGVGTLLVLVDANGRAQSMQLVMTNFTFALDSMTREIRTGYDWNCTQGNGTPSVPNRGSVSDCNGNGRSLSIVESGSSLTSGTGPADKRITYWFNRNAYGTGHGAIMRKIGPSSNAWVPITGQEIFIDDMQIVVSGTRRLNQPPGDTQQPVATIYIKGRAGVAAGGTNTDQTSEFELQTTIVQRLLDA